MGPPQELPLPNVPPLPRLVGADPTHPHRRGWGWRVSLYAVTVTVEFTVMASSRKQATKFAQQSIEERCVTLEDGQMEIAKVQLIDGHE